MHCLPAHRGEEIADAAIDGAACRRVRSGGEPAPHAEGAAGLPVRSRAWVPGELTRAGSRARRPVVAPDLLGRHLAARLPDGDASAASASSRPRRMSPTTPRATRSAGRRRAQRVDVRAAGAPVRLPDLRHPPLPERRDGSRGHGAAVLLRAGRAAGGSRRRWRRAAGPTTPRALVPRAGAARAGARRGSGGSTAPICSVDGPSGSSPAIPSPIGISSATRRDRLIRRDVEHAVAVGRARVAVGDADAARLGRRAGFATVIVTALVCSFGRAGGRILVDHRARRLCRGLADGADVEARRPAGSCSPSPSRTRSRTAPARLAASPGVVHTWVGSVPATKFTIAMWFGQRELRSAGTPAPASCRPPRPCTAPRAWGTARRGSDAVAFCMSSRQICAGHVPPNTVILVRGGSIGICPSWNPTHTAADELRDRADEPRVVVVVVGAGLADLRPPDVRGGAGAVQHDVLQDVVGGGGDLRVDDLRRLGGRPATGSSRPGSTTDSTGTGAHAAAAGGERAVGARHLEGVRLVGSEHRAVDGEQRVGGLADIGAAPEPHLGGDPNDRVGAERPGSAARTRC